MQHIPYKGVAPALNDLIGGQVPIAFASLPSVLAHLKSGRLVALGVSSPKRSPALPDVPAIGEKVPGYSGTLWVGLFVPRGVPADVETRLQQAMTQGARRRQDQGVTRAAGRGARDRDAGAVRDAVAGGHRPLGEDRQGVGRDGGLRGPGQIATLIMPSDVSWREGGVVADAGRAPAAARDRRACHRCRGARSARQPQCPDPAGRPRCLERGAGAGMACRERNRGGRHGRLRDRAPGAWARLHAARACSVQHDASHQRAGTLRAHRASE